MTLDLFVLFLSYEFRPPVFACRYVQMQFLAYFIVAQVSWGNVVRVPKIATYPIIGTMTHN